MPTLRTTALASALLALAATWTSTAQAQYGSAHGSAHSLLGPQHTCHHVIDILQRYGCSSNSCGSSPGLVHATAFGPALVPSSEIGDLELVSVVILSDGGGDCGPSFAITVRNNSCRDVTDFHISLVGVLGRIHPLSPTTVHRVEKLCAGQIAECEISLPLEALAMGRAGDQILSFRSLVVLIDSYDQLLESDEGNNLKVMALAEIPRPVIAEVGVVAGETVESRVGTDPSVPAIADSDPGVAPETDPGAAPGAAPGVEETPLLNPAPESVAPGPESPNPNVENPNPTIDDLDFNNLDLTEATATASRR